MDIPEVNLIKINKDIFTLKYKKQEMPNMLPALGTLRFIL